MWWMWFCWTKELRRINKNWCFFKKKNADTFPYMGVSKNRGGPPKWMVYNGKTLLKWMIWGENPLFLETPILISRLHLCVPQELREDEPLTRAAQGAEVGVPQHISFGVGNSLLVGGNSNIFYFYPDPWGNDPIWRIFFRWVETTN